MSTKTFLIIFLVYMIFLVSVSLYGDSPFRSDYYVTSPYHSTIGKGGERRNNLHIGMDIGPSTWDWIIESVSVGKVWYVGINAVYGKHVIIKHPSGIYFLYAHGETIYNTASGNVTEDTVLMKMGSTGYSDGPHLHFEAFRIIAGVKVNEDPEKYLGDYDDSVFISDRMWRSSY